MKAARVLVTGVAGFIGSHLAERLLRDGHRVVGIDCLTDYYAREIKQRNLLALQPDDRFCLLERDLLDLDLVALLNGQPAGPRDEPYARDEGMGQDDPFDYVFHLAGQPGVRGSWGNSFDQYTRNNIQVTQRILEAAKTSPIKKLVFASSSSIYGNAALFPTPESAIPQPISPYGVTKLAAEHLALLYRHNYGVPVVCLRFFTVYGPRQRPDMAFHRFIEAMLQDAEIQVYGDGEQTRDFTFVGDIVQGTLQAAFSPVVGRVFNLGGGSQVSVNQVIRTLEGITGRRARVRYSTEQKGDALHTGADISRAAAGLSFKPSTALEQGLKLQMADQLNRQS